MFYTKYIDISSPKSMWHFLHEHYSYYTMNSWNRSSSIANNVKLYNLNLEGDWTIALQYLLDECDAGGLQMKIRDEITDFEIAHPFYRVGFNGRSGGYLVLTTKNNQQVLPTCVANYDSYENFKADIEAYGETLRYYMTELRDTVEIVREFDRLCDRLRDIVNEYSLRNFAADKLEETVEDFMELYDDDLERLGLTGPELEDGYVLLNDCGKYRAFFNCFMRCLGEDARRVKINNNMLWLEEE